MGISTQSYFSNSIVGVPQVAGEYVDLFSISPSPKYAIGTKYERQDGAVFRYVHYSAAVNAGQLLGPLLAEVSKNYAIANSAVAPSSTYQRPTEPVGVYPGGQGSRFILISVAAGTTSGQFEGSSITLIGVAGGGYTYRVRGNDGIGNTLAGSSLLELYDQIQASVTTATYYAISTNKYQDLATTNTSTANLSVGVSVAGSTAGYFGWVQTQGLIGVSCAASAGTAGQLVSADSSIPGAVSPFIAVSTGVGSALNFVNAPVGVVAAAGSGLQHMVVDLHLEA